MYININSLNKEIEQLNYQQIELGENFEYFGPISSVNIFVGANNSGKSKFLRTILKSDKIALSSNLKLGEAINEFKKHCEDLIKKLEKVAEYNIPQYNLKQKQYDFDAKITEDKKIVEKLNLALNKLIDLKKITVNTGIAFNINLLKDLQKNILTYYSSNSFDKLNKIINENKLLLEIIYLIKKLSFKYVPIVNELNFVYPPPLYEDILEKIFLIFEDLTNYKYDLLDGHNNIYIPILRSAISLFNPGDDESLNKIFRTTITKNYNIVESEKVEVFTGQELYNSIKKIRNSKRAVRDNFDAFEKFLSKNFFNNNQVDIVALDSEDDQESKQIHLYIDNVDRPIYDLGDGIQSLIILMYPIFTAKNGTHIYIEEPEINLHPGLQRIFLEQIFKNEAIVSKKLKIFFTTHSNHLLDLSLEFNNSISIFSFQKNYIFSEIFYNISSVRSTNNNVLKLLQVNNSSVFLANCSIWVEGISDRRYIQAFLKAYLNFNNSLIKYKEDIHFSFFEYAGSNVMHYIFSPEINDPDFKKIKAGFLNNKVFLIADKDKDKDSKHSSLLAQTNDSFHYECLEVKEIENLLSPIQLKNHLPNIINKIDHNLLNNTPFIHGEYMNEYLGSYLINKNINIPLSFKAESGTLSTYYKNKLSEDVCKNIIWQEMSEYSQELTKRIYKFINQSNSH